MRTPSPRAYIPETDNTDWQTYAACARVDPDLFFPLSYDGTAQFQVEQAKAVCRRCPVLDACQTWTLTTRQPDGISGGLTPEERGIVRNNRRRAAE